MPQRLRRRAPLQHRSSPRRAMPIHSEDTRGLSRREALVVTLGAFGAAAGSFDPGILATPAKADEETESHGMSAFHDLKYPADFKHFDYINPNAPKGGVARMISIGTFDNFNLAVAGIKGSLAPAATLIYETLMTKSQDEVVTEYGLLAESAAHPDDFSW